MAVQPSEKGYSIPNVQFGICAKPSKKRQMISLQM